MTKTAKTTTTKTGKSNMKHAEINVSEKRAYLQNKSDVLDFTKIDERRRKSLSAYNDAQHAIGTIDNEIKAYQENFATTNAEILAKEPEVRTDAEKKTIEEYEAALAVMVENAKERRKPHKTAMTAALKDIFGNVQVKNVKKNEFMTLHDGYVLWVMEDKKGVMKDAMVLLFQNMGVATEKCNAGVPAVNNAIIDAFKAVGMQKVNNSKVAENREVAQYKPWSASTFKHRMMSHLIDVCRQNNVKI